MESLHEGRASAIDLNQEGFVTKHGGQQRQLCLGRLSLGYGLQ